MDKVEKELYDWLTEHYTNKDNYYRINFGTNDSPIVRFFRRGIRIITKSPYTIATAGLEERIPQDYSVVDVWKDIYDDDIWTVPVKEKILTIAKLLQKGRKVCVRCAAGINRSNNLAIASLVYLDPTKDTIQYKWKKYQKLVELKVDRAWMSSVLARTCQNAIYELQLNLEWDKEGYCLSNQKIVRLFGSEGLYYGKAKRRFKRDYKHSDIRRTKTKRIGNKK